MVAVLTYARRYALFTLVGIAGEDDLDAPDLPGNQLSAGTSGHLAPTRSTDTRYFLLCNVSVSCLS
jgi:hypothetical protein